LEIHTPSRFKFLHPLLPGLLIAAGIAGYGTVQLLTTTPLTGPRTVRWLEHGPRDSCISVGPTLVLGDRLIVDCGSGLAWIEPRTGTANIAWPIETDGNFDVLAMAPRDDDHFGVAFQIHDGGRTHLLVGIAGRDRWLVAPTEIAAHEYGRSVVDVIGAGWIDGALEIVITHPRPDELGTWSAPDVVRLVPGRPPIKESHPYPRCEGRSIGPCRTVLAALPTLHGWRLVTSLRPFTESRIELISERGDVTAAPPELAFWEDHDSVHSPLDRSALGVVQPYSSHADSRVERDGTRRSMPPPPLPDIEPFTADDGRLVFGGGVLRRRAAWARFGKGSVRAVDELDGKMVVIDSTDARVSIDSQPILRTSAEFAKARFVPFVDGARYWVTTTGEYVLLDRDFHRADPLTLRDHLRMRGSLGNSIDEPEHVWHAAWILFGFPLCLAIGLACSLARPRRLRARPVLVMAIAYVVTGGYALWQLLPLLG